MSKFFPRSFSLIAEHSICHPGLPLPQGLSHPGSLDFDGFQRTKSDELLLKLSTSTRDPAIISSKFFPESWPYFENLLAENNTLSSDT